MDKVTERVKVGHLSGVVAIVVGLIAVSNQSLWIDEANSAIKAIAPTFSAFADEMGSDRGSDLQMPLYMLMLWGWEKIFGRSEFALRAMNIPLFVIALILAVRCWHTSNSQRVFFVVFASSSAFLWAYLDEARPYILQFLGATACTIALGNVSGNSTSPRKSDIVLLASGVLILCGSSLLGVIFSFWFSAAFLVLWLMREPLGCILRRPDTRLAITVCLPALLALAVYYLWTLSLDAGASSVGSTNLKSIAFGAYELLGASGLGPGRVELRSSPMALLPFIAPVVAYIFLLILFLGAGTTLALRGNNSTSERKSAIIFWIAPAAMASTAVLVGLAGDFRIVGRHLTPLLPFGLILFSLAAGALWHIRLRMAGRAITILAILAMLGSALSYRTVDRHAKDDYRSAAALALETVNEGGTVWWAADRSAAQFYGLKTIVPDGVASVEACEGSACMANSRNAQYLAILPRPSLVILSKVDVYDPKGHLQQWLAENKFTLKGKSSAFDFFHIAQECIDLN